MNLELFLLPLLNIRIVCVPLSDGKDGSEFKASNHGFLRIYMKKSKSEIVKMLSNLLKLDLKMIETD